MRVLYNCCSTNDGRLVVLRVWPGAILVYTISRNIIRIQVVGSCVESNRLSRYRKVIESPISIAYIALVRTHLEYCSCLFASIAKTHSNKLEVVQKIAARIVCQAPHDAHSAPLLLELDLKSLEQRRVDHICRVVSQCLQGQCHPALANWFSADAEGFVIQSSQPSTAPGKKRFTYTAVNLFNRSRIKSGRLRAASKYR